MSTMLQEMDIKKALKAYIAGKKVLVMSTSTTDDTGEIMVDELEKFFPDCRFLVEVPAVVNQEFEEALLASLENTKEAKKLDIGKLAALYKAGWSKANIASELHVSIGTVNYHLKKLEQLAEGVNAET